MFKRSKLEVKKPDSIQHVATGFASPAQEFLEKKLDLNLLIAPHQESTFFVRVSEMSREVENFSPKDILVIDRSLNAKPNKWIIAVIDEEFEIGIISKEKSSSNNSLNFQPINSKGKIIPVNDLENFEVWGVITHVIHEV